MTSYEFVLKLNREVTDDEIDALYEAGCGDAGIETGPLGTVADFNREASSLAHAIVSAARDIEKVPDLRAVGVECDNMVSILDIAERTGVSREAVRLWVTGQRGRGGFPTPAFITRGNEQIWDWAQVAVWLEDQPRIIDFAVDALATVRQLRTADQVLAARESVRSEPDTEVREEFERLLQEA